MAAWFPAEHISVAGAEARGLLALQDGQFNKDQDAQKNTSIHFDFTSPNDGSGW